VKDLVAELHKRFKFRGWTIGLAESCTGGLLSSVLTQESGISEIYLGGLVTYANASKVSLLAVPRAQIKTHGAVSSVVALSMARGARKSLRSSWALSMTGVAGPTGGTADKPVGTVWFAAVGPGVEYTTRQVFQGDRMAIQQKTAEFALKFLLEKSL